MGRVICTPDACLKKIFIYFEVYNDKSVKR